MSQVLQPILSHCDATRISSWEMDFQGNFFCDFQAIQRHYHPSRRRLRSQEQPCSDAFHRQCESHEEVSSPRPCHRRALRGRLRVSSRLSGSFCWFQADLWDCYRKSRLAHESLCHQENHQLWVSKRRQCALLHRQHRPQICLGALLCSLVQAQIWHVEDYLGPNIRLSEKVAACYWNPSRRDLLLPQLQDSDADLRRLFWFWLEFQFIGVFCDETRRMELQVAYFLFLDRTIQKYHRPLPRLCLVYPAWRCDLHLKRSVSEVPCLSQR